MSGLQRRYLEMAPELAPAEASSGLEVFETAYDDTALNRYRARFGALAEPMYDRESERLKALTGRELPNPYRYTKKIMMEGNAEGLFGSSFERFEQQRQRLAEQRPELAGEINAGQHTLAELYKRQHALEKRAEDALDASPLTVNMWLFGKVNPIGMLGGMSAAFEDPMGWLENLVGFGGAAKGGARGLLWASSKAAVANAGVTAAAQPFVQEWRRQAGLEFGLERAATETLLAGLVGGGLDAGVRTGIRTVQPRRGMEPVLDAEQKIQGWRPRGEGERAPPPGDPIAALDEAASRAPADHPIAKAAAGDDEALLQVTRETGAIDADPAVRGAAAELERFRLFGPPPEIDPLDHYQRLAETIRRSADSEAPPPGVDLRAGPDIDPTTLSPELASARQRLIDQEGSPLDMAAMIRMAPELVDGAMHLSDHKMKQAAYLAKLSDEAFEMVAGGEIAPNHAAVVARHVADAGRHADLLRQITSANLRSEAQVKLLIGEATSRAGAKDVHAARTGAHEGLRELAGERARVLEAGGKALLREPRVVAAIEAEAGRLEAALPESLRGNRKLRTELGKRVSDVIEALSREPDSHISGLVQQAALALESGAGIRVTSRALAGRIADVVEREGLAGLARISQTEPDTLKGRGFSKPNGPEAKAQSDALAARIKLSLPDDGGSNGRRATGARAAASSGADQSAGRADARAGGDAAGGAGSGRRAEGRRDAGADGKPVGRVGNFAFDDGFVGTAIAGRTSDGEHYRRYWVHKDGAALPSENASANTVLTMMRQIRNWVAQIDVTERRPGVWEVGMVNVDPRAQRQHIAARLYAAIERDVAGVIEPSGKLFEKGFRFWQWRNANLVRHHQWSDVHQMWISPKEAMFYLRLADHDLNSGKLRGEALTRVLEERGEMMRLLDMLPDDAKSPAYLKESFSLADPVEPRMSVSPDWDKIRADVDEALRLLPRDVRTRVDDRIVFGGRDVDGMWDAHERLVRIALNERAPITARHEVMHALKDLGLIDEAEWSVMAARARTLYAEMNVEGRWRAQLEEAYPGDDARVSAALVEEAVAEMFGRWKGGARYGNAIDRVFKWVADLIERIGNALGGRGFQSADDVFRRIERGDVQVRPQRLDVASDLPRFSLKAMPHDKGFDHLADWLGIDPHRIVIDATHIAAKRRRKNQPVGEEVAGSAKSRRLVDQREMGTDTEIDRQLSTESGVMAFVREVLADGTTARKYKEGASWNVIRPREDGTSWLVSIDVAPDEQGRHLVRTAFVSSHAATLRSIPAVIEDHGLAGLKWKGDPAGLESLLAHVSEAQRAAPGRIPDSVPEMLRQHLDTARQLQADRASPAVREVFEQFSNDQISAEAARLRSLSRDAVDAERLKDLGDYGAACKS